MQGKAGSTNTIIFAVYGGNVAPLFGCSTTTASGILTISGDRQKIVTLSHCGVRSTNLTLTASGTYTILVHDADYASTTASQSPAPGRAS